MTELKNGDEHGAGHTLDLVINGMSFKWARQYITGFEIRELARISPELEIYLAIKKPWKDERIRDSDQVDLARPGVEHFYSKTHEHGLVVIFVNGKEYKVHRGEYSVEEIKNIGKVNPAHDLEEKIDGKLTPLKDDGHVLIKGGEEFFSHPKDGSSS